MITAGIIFALCTPFVVAAAVLWCVCAVAKEADEAATRRAARERMDRLEDRGDVRFVS